MKLRQWLFDECDRTKTSPRLYLRLLDVAFHPIQDKLVESELHMPLELDEQSKEKTESISMMASLTQRQRLRQKWSKEEESALWSAVASEKPIDQIAVQLQRSSKSIESKRASMARKMLKLGVFAELVIKQTRLSQDQIDACQKRISAEHVQRDKIAERDMFESRVWRGTCGPPLKPPRFRVVVFMFVGVRVHTAVTESKEAVRERANPQSRNVIGVDRVDLFPFPCPFLFPFLFHGQRLLPADIDRDNRESQETPMHD